MLGPCCMNWRNDMKWKEPKRNEMKWNEIEWMKEMKEWMKELIWRWMNELVLDVWNMFFLAFKMWLAHRSVTLNWKVSLCDEQLPNDHFHPFSHDWYIWYAIPHQCQGLTLAGKTSKFSDLYFSKNCWWQKSQHNHVLLPRNLTWNLKIQMDFPFPGTYFQVPC